MLHQTLEQDSSPPCLSEHRKLRTAWPRDCLTEILQRPGTSVTLDELLQALGADEAVGYASIANAVRQSRIVVEFEASGRPFPYRNLMVRRL